MSPSTKWGRSVSIKYFPFHRQNQLVVSVKSGINPDEEDSVFADAAFAVGCAGVRLGARQLLDGGSLANGSYDLRFELADAAVGGNFLGPTLTNAPVNVAQGLFSVSLDFGADVFDGAPRWLEISVRTNGSSGNYATLSRAISFYLPL